MAIRRACLHGAYLPGQCPHCRRKEAARRDGNNKRLGRTSAHWIKTSKRARELQPWCTDCGSTTDLTVDLVGGGDHSTASLAQCVVRCRSCHGRRDGGRP